MLGLGKAVQHAVIADVHAFPARHVALGIQDIEDVHPHVQLRYGGLPSGHVQLQPLALGILIFLLQLRLQRQQFLSAQLLICFHAYLPAHALILLTNLAQDRKNAFPAFSIPLYHCIQSCTCIIILYTANMCKW